MGGDHGYLPRRPAPRTETFLCPNGLGRVCHLLIRNTKALGDNYKDLEGTLRIPPSKTHISCFTITLISGGASSRRGPDEVCSEFSFSALSPTYRHLQAGFPQKCRR